MPHENLPLILIPPDLSDEAASELLDFLYEFARAFESYYFCQLRRHHTPDVSSDPVPPTHFDEGDEPPF
ncbi:MAG: hypothetical protein ACREVA_05080 [Burkholderiales bacterium]